MSGVRGPNHFNFDATRVLTHDDVNVLNGLSMTQFSAYAKIMCDENISVETLLATPDDAEIKCIVEVDLKHTDEIKQRILLLFLHNLK